MDIALDLFFMKCTVPIWFINKYNKALHLPAGMVSLTFVKTIKTDR